MNYQALKSMIEGILQSYICPDCKINIQESNIDIIGAAGNTVNIDIECPKCKKHSIVKSQIMHMNLEGLNSIKDSLINIKTNISDKKILKKIRDSEISELSKDLKNTSFKVSDLFEG